MDNTFDLDNHDKYTQVLDSLEIPIIDKELKKAKLWSLMGIIIFLSREDEVNALDSNDPDKYEKEQNIYLRYTRQFGSVFRIKKRKLDLKKNYNLDKIIDHYGIFFDNNEVMFHLLPDGVRYGNKEYNREVTNEWELVDLNNGKPFFTLMDIDEISSLCKKWNLEQNDIELFAYVMAYWLL